MLLGATLLQAEESLQFGGLERARRHVGVRVEDARSHCLKALVAEDDVVAQAPGT